MRTSISIRFTFRQFTLFRFVLLTLSVFFIMGTALSNELKFVPKGLASRFFFNQINLAVENVIAAWYSSMLLLLIASAAFFCYFIERQQKANTFSKFLNWGWIVLGLIFLTLSLDEMGSFHKLIGESALFHQIGFGTGKGWNVFYLLILLVALFMITFFLSKIKTSKRSFVFLTMGTLLFLSNPFQEAIELSDYHSAAQPNFWKRDTGLLLLEEGSEILGMLCFFSAMALYAFDCRNRFNQSTPGINLNIRITQSAFLSYIFLIWLVCFILMTAIYLNANQIIKGDDGVAHNWFPSAGFFLVALVALYKTLNNKRKRGRKYYGLLAFLALFQSLYYGSNIYASELVYNAVFMGISIHHLILFLNISIGGLLFLVFNHYWCRITLAGFLAITLSQFITTPALTPFFGYTCTIFLFGVLLIDILTKSNSAFDDIASADQEYPLVLEQVISKNN